jgi:hypothetical protein
MSEHFLYKYEAPVRPKNIIFLVGFGGFWFGFFGNDLIVNQNVTVESVIGTIVFVPLACLFILCIIKGGTERLEITDEAVHWHCPVDGDGTIRHEDVESFEILVKRVPNGEMSRTCARLKSGETVIIAPMGDPHTVHQILLMKWKYLGRRVVR